MKHNQQHEKLLDLSLKICLANRFRLHLHQPLMALFQLRAAELFGHHCLFGSCFFFTHPYPPPKQASCWMSLWLQLRLCLRHGLRLNKSEHTCSVIGLTWSYHVGNVPKLKKKPVSTSKDDNIPNERNTEKVRKKYGFLYAKTRPFNA